MSNIKDKTVKAKLWIVTFLYVAMVIVFNTISITNARAYKAIGTLLIVILICLITFPYYERIKFKYRYHIYILTVISMAVILYLYYQFVYKEYGYMFIRPID